MGKQGSLVLNASYTFPPTLWAPLPSLPNTSRNCRVFESGKEAGVAPQLEPQCPWTTSGMYRELIPLTKAKCNPNVSRDSGARWPGGSFESLTPICLCPPVFRSGPARPPALHIHHPPF